MPRVAAGSSVEGDAEALRFVPAAPPSHAELYALTERVALRVMTWLRKRGYAKDDDHASNEAPERSFAEPRALLVKQEVRRDELHLGGGRSRGEVRRPTRTMGRPGSGRRLRRMAAGAAMLGALLKRP